MQSGWRHDHEMLRKGINYFQRLYCEKIAKTFNANVLFFFIAFLIFHCSLFSSYFSNSRFPITWQPALPVGPCCFTTVKRLPYHLSFPKKFQPLSVICSENNRKSDIIIGNYLFILIAGFRVPVQLGRLPQPEYWLACRVLTRKRRVGLFFQLFYLFDNI